MKKYESVFIGIPLPEEFRQEFNKIINWLELLGLGIRVVKPEIPHITVHFLNRQLEPDIIRIKEKIEPLINELFGLRLIISGIGTFGGRYPRVVFLRVIYPMKLELTANQIKSALSNYYQEPNPKPFHPHLTLGRINSKGKQHEVTLNLGQIENYLDQISWEFSVEQVSIYAIDPTDQLRLHREIVTYPSNSAGFKEGKTPR